MTASNLPYPKVCIYCQKVFEARKSSARFCSLQCAQRAYKENERQKKLAESNQKFQKDLMTDIQKIQAREVLSLEQVATLLGVSRWTINRFIKKGKLKTVKVLGRRLILRIEINKILNID